mmetsp:Transcript_72801/g.152062  ORF Transcript_72801/g.152062 Transcript_72801/m.152062 type:complete len:195 (+) Transcript_72801:1-585(+)
MEITSVSNDGWCVTSLSIDGKLIADEDVWLDNPCVSNSEHVCATTVTYSFALPFTIPGTGSSLCQDWILGYSGESCTETCSRRVKSCVMYDIEELNNLAAFEAMMANATDVEGAPLGTMAEFCDAGVNVWPFATAPSAMRTPTHQLGEIVDGVQESTTVLKYSCYYPAITIGDCDTKFVLPQSQRFCSCDGETC